MKQHLNKLYVELEQIAKQQRDAFNNEDYIRADDLGFKYDLIQERIDYIKTKGIKQC